MDDREFLSCAFDPYIGPTYVSAACRVLVLGESHYSKDPNRSPDRTLTRRVVRDALSGEHRHRFFSSVASVLVGQTRPLAGVWAELSFYNYVQEYAGTEPRQRPRPQAWKASASAFQRVLQVLQPHLVLVCGAMLWNALKAQDGLSDMPEQGTLDKRVRSRIVYGDGGWTAIGGVMNHPASFGFRAQEWAPRVSLYRERAMAHLNQRART